MNYRDHEFTLPEPVIDLEIQWSYYYDPGRTNCRNDDARPAEEECEVWPPVDLAARLKAFAESMIPVWTKEIESQCADLAFHNKPRDWAREE